MENTVMLIISLLIGALIGALISKLNFAKQSKEEINAYQIRVSALENELAGLKSATFVQLENQEKEVFSKQNELDKLIKIMDLKSVEFNNLQNNEAYLNASLLKEKEVMLDKNEEIKLLKLDLNKLHEEFRENESLNSNLRAKNESANEKLLLQKNEMEEMGKKFNTEFENIASKILESKSEKFTEINKTNLQSILEPLGKNISEFKTKVEEVYDKEAKERFSLGEKVKELADLNKTISEEARNLTKALKGESKTQGRWGEMILESILERSGLVKDREYFMEYQLEDELGNALRSDSENKKMRPDAVIKYPDNRSVIIDSKVSLNAFSRFSDAVDVDVQKVALAEHVQAIKNHIIALSSKGYDDYNKALDFVMMFVPSESAYMAALQGDSELWNYAYDKRILLLSPTNLITSLKLIADLWKREFQNRNAIEIADRGAKLFDKFVGFVENMKDIGAHIDKAQGKYSDAYKQLTTGNDNLVAQATKLKNLGLKPKKELPKELGEE
jgi:DNA recombination protein RmuC